MPEFVTLAAFFGPKEADAEELPLTTPEAVPSELVETLGSVRRFRAALADAVDAAVARLLPEIAATVLGRELQLAAPDIGAIVSAALERYRSEGALAVRLHPDDVIAAERLPVQRVADRALCRGDAIFELRSGTINATLKTRLAAALAAC